MALEYNIYIVSGLGQMIRDKSGADQLAARQLWSSTIDALNAWLSVQCRGDEVNCGRLEELARRKGVSAALSELLSFVANHRTIEPTGCGIERWSSEIPR